MHCARGNIVFYTHLPVAGLKYAPAVAGMFLWLDLREPLLAFSKLRKASSIRLSAEDGSCVLPTWEDEASFHREILSKAKVVLTPGGACHASEPGFARCCFMWMELSSVEVAFERMGALFARLLRESENAA